MLTRDFRLLEERTRHSLKPLFSHFFLPAPSITARLDLCLRSFSTRVFRLLADVFYSIIIIYIQCIVSVS